jgi:hypothetical protein
LEECPYTIAKSITRTTERRIGEIRTIMPSVKLCRKRGVEQAFTKVKNPKTNGKAEGVIKIIKEL